MNKRTCCECGSDTEDAENPLCRECSEMSEFFSHFTDEELEEAERNMRQWVESGCPMPAEMIGEEF